MKIWYACPSCGRESEVEQGVFDSPEVKCECGSIMDALEIQMYLKVSELLVDPNVAYQREYKELWAREIAKNFQRSRVGSFRVALVGGKYYVTDGQHRLMAIRMLIKRQIPGGMKLTDGMVISCLVKRPRDFNESLDDTITGWKDLPTNNVDEFIAKSKKAGTRESRIFSALRSEGVEVSINVALVGGTRAVGAINDIFDRAGFSENEIGGVKKKAPYEELLKRTARVLRACFPNQRCANRTLLLGFARFLHYYSKKVDDQRLVSRIRKEFPDHHMLMRAAQSMAKVAPDVAARNLVPNILHIHYNKSLQKDRLPNWPWM